MSVAAPLPASDSPRAGAMKGVILAGCRVIELLGDIIFEHSIAPHVETFALTAVNNEFVRRGQLEYGLVQGRWTDAGTFDSLSPANEILLAIDNEVLV